MPHQIARLEKIRRAGDQDHHHGFTYPELKLSMAGDFKLDTLMRALAGKPIWERYYAYIVEWLDRYFPEKPLTDGKSASAGEKVEEDAEATEATQTVRRSR